MDKTSLRIAGASLALAAGLVGLLNLVTLFAVDRRDLLLSTDALLPLSAALVGWLVLRRVPGQPVGWLLLAMAASSAAFGASALVVMETTSAPGWVATPAAWLSTWVWLPSYLIAFWFIPMLFPDGRAVSRRWRPVVWASSALLAVESVLLAFGTEESIEPSVANPFAFEPVTSVLAAVEPVIYLTMTVLVVVGVGSLVHRLFRAQGLARVQVLCVLVAAAVSVTYYLLTRSGLLLALLLPVAIAVAVLRYRLYDVERILLRTILYGGLALTAALVYVGIVLTAGSVLGLDEDLRLQATALIVAVLVIHPLRDRAMDLGRRLVYGKHSRPYDALAALAQRVGAAVSPDETLPRMADVVASALRARTVTVTAHLPEGASTSCTFPPVPDASTAAASVVRPVVHQGIEVGSIEIHRDAELTAREQNLLDVLVAQAGPALRTVALTEELRAELRRAVEQAEELRSSRARLVTAHDSARRAIERDLHDGAQQGLLAIAVELGRVQRKVASDPAEAVVRLTELQDLARRTLVELRALAAGTYPPVLRELGLGAALRERTKASAPTVAVHDELTHRPAPEVESAVYFACMEAVTNAVKHAAGTRIDVRLSQGGGNGVQFTVTDDGRGFDTTAACTGTGLTGMADRLGVLGGGVRVDSRSGAGTTVVGLAYDEAAERYISTA